MRPWHLPSLPGWPLTWGGPMLHPLPTLSYFSPLVTACRRLWRSPLYPSPWKKLYLHASWIHRVNPQLLCNVTGFRGASVHHHGLTLSIYRCSCCVGAQWYLVGWGLRYIFSVIPPQLLTGAAAEGAKSLAETTKPGPFIWNNCYNVE